MADMTADSQPRRRKPRQRSWWIPWAFVGAFGVVLAANGTMLLFALDSFTGLETEQAYQKGLAYNDEIAAAERQAKLGWSVELDIAQAGPTATEPFAARIALDIADSVGNPLDGATVTAKLVRPTQAGHDVTLELPRTAAGRYDASVALPLAGVWDLRIEVAHDRGDYRLSERLVLE